MADGYRLGKSHSVKSFYKGGKHHEKELRACAVSVILEGFTLLVFMVASGVLNFLEEDFSLRKSTALVSSLNVGNIINAFFYEGFFFISVASLCSHGEGRWAPKGSVSMVSLSGEVRVTSFFWCLLIFSN